MYDVPVVQPVSEWAIGLRGFGPIRYGMTIAEAQSSSGLRLDVQLLTDANDCGSATITSGPRNVSFGVATDRRGVLRILNVEVKNTDISGRAYSQGTPRTRSGIGISSTFAQVRRTYLGRTRAHPDAYGGPPRLLYTSRDRADREFGVLFDTEDGRTVSGISAGDLGFVTAPEGCF